MICADIDRAAKEKSAVSISGLTVKYGSTTALSGISIDISEGEYLGIIGPNGGGKTTLLKSILGLVLPAHGRIEVFGKKPGSAGNLIGYVPQITSLEKNFPVTVGEVVLTGMLAPGLSFFHKYSLQDKKMTQQIQEDVGIYDIRDRMVSELSGGEFQKMLIARALVSGPQLLLLDEPTANVDASSRDHIFSLLKDLNRTMTIMLVTHDLLAVSSHVKSLACLNNRLVYHGGTEINEKIVSTLYGCPVDLIAHGVPHRVLKEHSEGH